MRIIKVKASPPASQPKQKKDWLSGNTVKVLETTSLPLGILDSLRPDTSSYELLENDIQTESDLFNEFWYRWGDPRF